MMTQSQRRSWKKFCSEPLELVENYRQALAENFKGWCMHHRLEIQPDGTRVSRQELKEKGLYLSRPAEELIFMRFGEHSALHSNGNTYMKGKHLTAETRQKISEVIKGRTFSAEHRHKLSKARKGRTFSAEHRQKLSEAHKGKQLSV